MAITREKINILFIHPYRHSIGPNVVLLNLIKWLNRDKFNLFAVFPSKPKFNDELEKNNVKTFFLSTLSFIPRTYNPLILFIYFLKQCHSIFVLKRIIKNNKIDIVHVSTVISWPVSLVAKICRIKCVFHAQDLTSMKPKLVGVINAFFLNLFSDIIICVSRAVADAWQKVGVMSQKLVVVYNGVDLEKFKPLAESEYIYLKKELKIEGKFPLIGMIAAMDPRKGHRYFIQAASQIKKMFPKSIFFIIGSLDFPEHFKYFKNLKHLVKDLNLEESLFFLGERKDIPQIINLCDLIVVPSETEAGPFIVLETQACGKPIIASDVGGVPEYLENNKTGFLVGPRNPDQLAKTAIDLLNNYPKLKLAGLAGREFVQKFKVQEKIKVIENLYLKLLNQK